MILFNRTYVVGAGVVPCKSRNASVTGMPFGESTDRRKTRFVVTERGRVLGFDPVLVRCSEPASRRIQGRKGAR
jgi:hypothetical protein